MAGQLGCQLVGSLEASWVSWAQFLSQKPANGWLLLLVSLGLGS